MTKPAASASAEPEAVRASLSPQIAAEALTFLSRTMIQWAEMDSAMRVRLALEAIALRGGE